MQGLRARPAMINVPDGEEPNVSTVKQRWIDLVRRYHMTNERQPTSLLATRDDEHEWLTLPATELGDQLASRVLLHGIREAMPRFLGIPITWDQPETKVV